MVLKNTNDYMLYAVGDLISKNIFLYSDYKIMDIYNNNYKYVKSKLKELTLKNNADMFIVYDIKYFRDGFLLNYIIYNNSDRWYENETYFEEKDLFMAVNKVLSDFYRFSDINSFQNINELEYTSLIGYYSQVISNDNIEEVYNLFYNFYKDNNYFNMDYLEYLFSNNISSLDEVANNILKHLNKKSHYYFYVLGIKYYNSYKINVVYDDIEKSILNYNKALKLKPNSFNYNKKLANAYLLKNDYINALKYYNAAIKLNNKDTSTIKESLNILKRDFDNNSNTIIEYLQKIINIDKNDDESIEELAKLYESIGDYHSAYNYYNKLLEAINYHLYIINNERPNAILYDKYINKKNKTQSKIKFIENKLNM